MKDRTLGKLGTRLLHSIIVTASIIFIIILLAIISIRLFLNENIKGQRSLDAIDETATQIYQAVNDQIIGQRGYCITGDTYYLDTYDLGVEKYKKNAEDIRMQTKIFPLLVHKTDEFVEKGQYIQDELIAPLIFLTDKDQGVNTALLQQSEKALEEFRQMYSEYYWLVEEQRTIVRNTMRRKINTILISVVIAVFFTNVVAVIIEIKILKKVIQPIIQLSNSVKAYTEHDFTKNVPAYKKRDELSELIGNIDIMRSQLANNIQSLEYIANMDALTGLYNRRYFNQHIEEQWKRAIARSEPISLILLDIDHYKKFNDTYGHVKGDECLQKIADCLKQHNQFPDKIVCRYGGEEFCLLLNSSNEHEAEKLSEEIRKDVLGLKLPHESSPTHEFVTVSVGVATVVPKKGSNPNDLILMADEALYHSKNNGRNQVTLYKNEGVGE